MPEKGGRELTRFVLMATVLGVIDSLLPRPVPFMKLGLANIVSVIVVMRYGMLRALELNLLRAVAVALVTGLLATPSFLLSLSGAFSSVVVMGLFAKVFREKLSIPGLSVAGAVASLWCQLFVAGYIVHGLPLHNIVLLLSVWGIFSGALVGVVAKKAIDRKSRFYVLRKTSA